MAEQDYLTDFQLILVVYNWLLQANPLNLEMQEQRKIWDELYVSASWQLTIVLQTLHPNIFSRFWVPRWSASQFSDADKTYFGMPVYEESAFQSSLWQVLKWGEEAQHTTRFEQSLRLHVTGISQANRVKFREGDKRYRLLLTKVADWRACSTRLFNDYHLSPRLIFAQFVPFVHDQAAERDHVADILIKQIQDCGVRWGYPNLNPNSKEFSSPSRLSADREEFFGRFCEVLEALCGWEPFQADQRPFKSEEMRYDERRPSESTHDPQKNGLVTKTIHWGYREKASGVVRRKAVVRVYRFEATT